MKKRVIIISIIIILVILVVGVWYVLNMPQEESSENTTVQKIQELPKQPIKNLSQVVSIYSDSTETACNSLVNESLRNNCIDWAYLKEIKNGKKVECSTEMKTAWGFFMCGFIKTPTVEYCTQTGYVDRNLGENLCNVTVEFITNPNYNGDEALAEWQRERLLVTKAFYFSDSKYCDSMKGIDFSIPKKLCYAVAS